MHLWLSTWEGKNLTQKPTSPNNQQPLTAFETRNGRSAFAAGTAFHVALPRSRTKPLLAQFNLPAALRVARIARRQQDQNPISRSSRAPAPRPGAG